MNIIGLFLLCFKTPIDMSEICDELPRNLFFLVTLAVEKLSEISDELPTKMVYSYIENCQLAR